MGKTILHISTRLILGGSQENTVLSCIGQSRLGHQVHLAYGPIFGPEGSHKDTVERFNQRVRDGLENGATEIVLHELPNMVREINPWKDHFCFHCDLKHLMKAVKPDVVHTHSSKAGILGRWAAWKIDRASAFLTITSGAEYDAGGDVQDSTLRKIIPSIRIIHTIHGPPFMPIEGSVINKAKVGFKNWIYTIAERFAAKRCHVIVSVADAMTEQFLDRKIGKPSQYVTVRSGMEVEGYLNAQENEDRASIRRELGFSDHDFVIGTVARLAQHKGHDDILDGLGDDLKANPNWKLLWVGDGWWTDRLMGRVRSLGLENQVVHTGLVPHARVPAMMRAMDVLLHPSYREGLPRTVPQALLCGVPVVATDTDGTPEVCLDARQNPIYGTGLLFPVGDSTRLRECVVWMQAHPQDRRRLGDVGRGMCSEMFSTERMIEGLEAVYEQVIGGL